MAFWGVEVKPGKPVTHSCEKARGRLRISQATLGISTATNKSIVQCNVGKRSPVLLCALLPNHTESCHLDLEFEEADDVVFSVIGPRSVYLTGYYVRQSQQSNPHSDTESYGVDIENTQTEESSYHSDDDSYEDSFIDDGNELQEFSASPVLSSKVEDETTSENDEPKNKKGRGRRLWKKSQVVESDKDETTSENDKPKNENGRGSRIWKKCLGVELDKDASSHESEYENGFLLSVFKSKTAAKKTSTGVEANNFNQDLPTSNGKDQMQTPDLANPKKKRKERSKEEKTSEVQIDKDRGVSREDNKHEIEASKNMEIGDQVPPESSSGNRKKSKKRRKEQLERTSTEGIDVKFHNVAKDDKLEPGSLHTDSEKKNLPEANGVQEQQIDNNVNIKSESLVNDNQPERETKKKMKKKKKKIQGEGDLNIATKNNQENTLMTFENQTTDLKPMQNKTLSNGLIIEEVANGPPDGKVASHGKKVKIIYTAMLKENGHVFDSNVGKSACKFRLGDEEIIDGWNLGIEGMHVGDKRRLTIPPSMSSGKDGAGENVPPNSWLVYDVELVSVHR